MDNEPERTTPPAEDKVEPNPTPGTPPIPFWEVLEQEFEALYPGKLGLDAEYRKIRDGEIAKVKEGLKSEIATRLTLAGKPDEIDAEAQREMEREPELVNGPACQELFARLHGFINASEANPPQAALCLSGGGIRSATFALGVLQGLARQGALGDFDYLSTVSGGGYIGSWLSSWIMHQGKNPAPVLRELGTPEKPSPEPAEHTGSSPQSQDPRHTFKMEPATIGHLRAYSNYLTPSLGLLSGDGWAVAATVLRNLLLNWLLIIPAVLFVLLFSRLALQVGLLEIGQSETVKTAFCVAGFVAGVVALGNLILHRGRSQLKVLVDCVLPILVFSACATLAWFWSRRIHPGTGSFDTDPRHWGFYVVWGALTPLLAFAYATIARWVGKVDPPKNRLQRLAWLVVVFGLTGLAACWLADNAAGGLRQEQEARNEVMNAAPAPPAAPAWALWSQTKKDCNVSLWVPLNPAKPSPLTCPDFPGTPDEQKSCWDLQLRSAVLAVCFGFPVLLALVFCSNTVLTGLLSRTMKDEEREWLARASGWSFLLAIAFCALNVIVLLGPEALVWLWDHSPKLISTLLGGSGLLTIIGGKSDKTSASSRPDVKPGSKDWIVDLATKLAAPIFIVLLLALCSLLTTLLLQKVTGETVDPRHHCEALVSIGWAYIGVAIVVFGLFTWGSSYCVNVNKFSLHAMYRDRLIRAYLGATNPSRNPNLFTGFDPNDNFGLDQLRGQKPLHVLNLALNLVSGKELAWQQRLAMSFTMTPYTCGASSLGYRDSAGYAKNPYDRGMTLGTALALSGAAVSPNHGYSSTPLIAFLLTFFNARLGGWFGNPGTAGGKSWTDASPDLALVPLVAEALGQTDADHPYVYLSDGGHFENLALYEMVLRRCRTIVVSDGGCDPDYGFEDLGNAIAKIRVDFGIPIDFEEDIDIRKQDPGFAKDGKPHGKHCAVGTIHYSAVDPEAKDGTLIYLKPAMCGREPVDVFHYFHEHPAFPHEPTSDQWFTESQFESYRMLGSHTIDEICGAKNEGATDPAAAKNLATFVARAKAYVAPRAN